MFADKVYKQRIDKFSEYPNRDEVIRKYGGTSYKGIIIYIAVVVVAVVAFMAFFGAGSIQ